MPDRWEDRIRRFLAQHIEVLESGLTLVSQEYCLPNPLGAGGKIDLLAKDPFGHWVIIEVKRSDQAARQTLNEVHKYTALFRMLQGLDEIRVRVIVVSTEWHELLVPFSEYVSTAAYSVTGISISALADGTVTHAEKVSVMPRGDVIAFSRCQSIYLFESLGTRDEKLPILAEVVERSCIADYALLSCDYAGQNPAVIYKYGIYLVFVPPSDMSKTKGRIKWEDSLDLPEENFACAINEVFVQHWDSYEIGYPEKLVTISSDWDVKVSVRGGRLGTDRSLWSDAEILRMAKAIEGGSPVYLGKLSSPRFGAAWKELRTNLEPVLAGNAQWFAIVPLFLQELEVDAPDASVSVSIYSPFNFPMTMFSLADGDYSKCAQLEIAVDHSSTDTVRILRSLLAWNGRIVDFSPGKMMKRVYGSFDNWTWRTHFHETREQEDKAMVEHGFSTPTVEMLFSRERPPEVKELTMHEGKLVRSVLDPHRCSDASDFVRDNRSYLVALQSYLRKRIAGI
jgi:Endonuclease NucS